MSRKILSLLLSFCFLFQQTSFAQVAAVELNLSGYFAKMANSMVIDKFRPLHLRYFSYDSLNNEFKVLLDRGDLKNLQTQELENSTKTLLSYFLIGVTLPNDKFWVNLRPDSPTQIIDEELAETDIGKIMLEADLQLKKDTASFTSPNTPEGKEYWDKLYKKAEELYGYDTVTIPTLTRPWIVPGEIIIRETKDSAYIYKANLKVMLEQDYLKDSSAYNFKDTRSKALNEYSSQLIRELIIPKLTKEVNISKRYAPLRQVYYSLIISRWFKSRFYGKSGTYVSLIDKQDLTNLTSKDSWSKATYFNAYKKSFAEGEYNIKEPVYTPTGQVIRSYFSGGMDLTGKTMPQGVANGFIGASPLFDRVLARTFTPVSGNSLQGTLEVGGKISASPVQAGSPTEQVKASSALVLDEKRLSSLELYKAITEMNDGFGRGRYSDSQHGLMGRIKSDLASFNKKDAEIIRDYFTIRGSGNYWRIWFENKKYKQLRDEILKAAQEPNNEFGLDPEWVKAWIFARKVFDENYSFERPPEWTYNTVSKEFGSIVFERKMGDDPDSHLKRHFSAIVERENISPELAEKALSLIIREDYIELRSSFMIKPLWELPYATPSMSGNAPAASSAVISPEDQEKARVAAREVFISLREEIGQTSGWEFIVRSSPQEFALRLYNMLLKKLKGEHLVDVALRYFDGGYKASEADYPLVLHWRPELDGYPLALREEARPQEDPNQTGSPLIPEGKTGGIDFRALPLTIQPMGSFSGLNFSLPKLSQAELERINLDEEMRQIQNMVENGILPSGQRVKELMAACSQKDELGRRREDIIVLLVKMGMLEETQCCESTPEYREALVIADSMAI